MKTTGITYRKELNRNYLVIQGEEGETEVDYQLRMVMENRISAFLHLMVRQVDCHLEGFYDISGLQTLEQWMEHCLLHAEQLRALFEGLLYAEKATEEYLLDENRILLRTECILIQPETWKVFFCFGFSSEQELMGEIRELMQYLLTRLDHSDQETIRIGYTLYQNCQQEQCTLTELVDIFSAKTEIAPVEKLPKEEWCGDTDVLTELPAYVPSKSYGSEVSVQNHAENKEWMIWSIVSGAAAVAFLILGLINGVQEFLPYPVRIGVTVFFFVNCLFSLLQYRKKK